MKIKSIVRSSRKGELERWFPGWLAERFGDHVAQISVHTTLKLKSAVKDCSRLLRKRCQGCDTVYETPDVVQSCSCGSRQVHGFVPEDIEELSKKMKLPPQGVTDHHFVMGYEIEGEGWVRGSSEPGHTNTDEALLTYIERYPQDWQVVQKALGLPRQMGRHACGYVIANRPIHDWIPLTSVSGVKVTAYAAPAVEAVGGVKMDFLGLNSLKDIQGAIKLIQERSPQGVQTEAMTIAGRRVPPHRLVPDPVSGDLVDIWDLPEDQGVFADVCEGRSETVFQFNTPGARQWMEHFNYDRPDGLKAIYSVLGMAAFTALDRPGPLDVKVPDPDWMGPPDHEDARHNMLVEYARRARGAKPSPGILQILEQLVPETFGVMTYQEQLQRVYQSLTGCSGAEAEDFRTNVAKKKKEKVDAAYPGWMERAGAKIGAENAQKLWEFIKTWAQYGFNLSHAVCYAYTGYCCAWLKHHYPLEWWCSVLRNAAKDEVNDKFWPHVGPRVSLPDLQLSRETWFIDGDRIRAPMDLLHGVGEQQHQALCKYSPYSSVEDFAEKLVRHRELAMTSVKKTKHLKKGDVEYTEYRLGREAVNRKTVWTLVVAGSMDSLFPRDLPVAGCVAAFDKAMLEALDKRIKTDDPALKTCWKKAFNAYKKRVKSIYGILDPITRYQIKKSVLPAWGSDLRAVYRHLELPPCLRMIDDGRKMRYVWKRYDPNEGRKTEVQDPVIAPERLGHLNTDTNLPQGGYRCGILAYVEAKRTFNYGPKKEKRAIELTLDVGGGKHKLVVWPNQDNELPQEAVDLESGSIVACLLVRRNPEKPFSIKEMQVLRTPPAKAAAETEEEESPSAEEAQQDRGTAPGIGPGHETVQAEPG